jgi:autotransporter-associated beta strand protein
MLPLYGWGLVQAMRKAYARGLRQLWLRQRIESTHLACEPLETRQLLATLVWTGGGSTESWGDDGNWQILEGSDGDVIPDADDTVIFRTDGAGLVDLGGGASAEKIVFDGDGSFTLEGGTLVLGAGGIEQTSSATGTNVLDVQLSSASLTGVVAGGSLRVNSLANATTVTDGTWTIATGGTLVVNASGTVSGLGATEVILDGGTLETTGASAPIQNALDHFGYHINNDNLALNLHNNGGMMGGAGGPTTFTTFEGHGLLTEGPYGRGLDFDNDGDFRAVRASVQDNAGNDGWVIDQNDTYSNLWVGYFTPNVSGNWSFRRGVEDDTAGIWLDLNQNGTFESSAAGLGSNRGEQLQWDNDTAAKTVSLVAGQSYLVAITHREASGGSQADFRLQGPAGSAYATEAVINPATTHAGLFRTAFSQSPPLAVLGNSISVIGSGSTIAIASSVTFASLTNAPGVTLHLENDNKLGSLTFGTTTLGGDLTVNLADDLSLTLNTIAETAQADLTFAGNGVVTLRTANSHTGVTTIGSGIVVDVSVNGALGTTAGGTVVEEGGTLRMVGTFNYSAAEAISLGGTFENPWGNTDFYGSITSSSLSARVVNSTGTLQLFGQVDINGQGLTFNTAVDMDIENGGITGAGTITKEGDARVNLRSTAEVGTNFDATLIINNGRWNAETSSALGSAVGDTIVQGDGMIEVRGGITLADNIFIIGDGEGTNSGAIRSENNSNTLTGVITMTGNAQIHVNATQLTIAQGIEYQGVGPYVLQKVGAGRLILHGPNDIADLQFRAGILQVGHAGAFGQMTTFVVNSGLVLEFAGNLTFDASGTLENIVVNNGTLSSVSGTTVLDVAIHLGGQSTITFDGAGQLIVEQGFGNGSAVQPNPNAFSHYGFHVSNTTQLFLNNNGGVMGGGDPTTHASFNNQALLIDGPGFRGLDFNSDGDFTATGAVTFTENYSNLFLGYLNVPEDQGGVWQFRLNQWDDQAGFWIDLDQDGIFETPSTAVTNTTGATDEQMSWTNSTIRSVNLVDGQRYLVAVTHREGTGGSGVDMQFAAPGGTLTTINPGAPSQLGLWTSYREQVPNNRIIKTGTGTVTLMADTTVNLETQIQGGTLAVGSAGALGLVNSVTVGPLATLGLVNNVVLDLDTVSATGIGAADRSGAITNISGDNILLANIVNTGGPTSTLGIGSESGELTLGSAAHTVNPGGGTLNFGGAGEIVVESDLVSGEDLTKTGAGTVTINGTNSLNGQIIIQDGTLILPHAGALGSPLEDIVVQDGGSLGLTGNVTVAHDILANGLGFNGQGAIVNISGDNTITGTITASGLADVAPGAIFTPASLGIGSRDGTLEIAGTIDLKVSDLTVTGDGDTTISGTITTTDNTARGRSGPAGLLVGRISTSSINTTSPNPGNVGVQLGVDYGQTNSGTIWTPSTTYVYSGWFYDADGIFSFAENIDDIVELKIDGNVVLRNNNWNQPASSGGSTNNLAPAGNAKLNLGMGPNGDGWHQIDLRLHNGSSGGGANTTTGWTTTKGIGLNVDGTTSINGADYIIPIDSGDGLLFQTPDSVLVTETIENALNKTGAGTLRITSAQDYTGPTTISSGTLIAMIAVGSATGSGDVTVGNGASLIATGTLAGGVSVESGGTLSLNPGAAGELNLSAITLSDDAVFSIELNSPFTTPGTDVDRLNVTSGVLLGGATLDLTVSGTPDPVQTIVLIDQAGADPVVGTFQDPSGNDLTDGSLIDISGKTFAISYFGGDGNDVVLHAPGSLSISGTSDDNLFVVRQNGLYLEVLRDGVVVETRPLIAVTGLEILGGDGDDTFTIDYAFGGFFDLPITVDGQGQTGVGTGDEVVVIGGTFADVVLDHLNANDGSITLDGTVITYRGLEPVTVDVLGTTLTVNLSALADQTTLSINGSGNLIIDNLNGTHEDDSVAGIATFTTIIVNTGGGADTITLDASLAAFTGVSGKTLSVSGTAVTGDSVIVGAGVQLTGNSDHAIAVDLQSGSLALTAGAQFDSLAGNAASTAQLGGFTLTVGDTTSTTMAGVISGTGSLVKAGSGTWTLSGANAYVGTTTVQAGTLRLGITNALPTTTALTIGIGASVGALDLAGFSQTVASLSVTSNSAAVNTITISTGQTLTVTGAMNVGVTGVVGNTTKLTATGGGRLNLTGTGSTIEFGLRNSNQNLAANVTTVDLTGLGAFDANVTNFRVGFESKNQATLLLSDTSNTITATTISVGDSNMNNASPAIMRLGAGINVLNATTITLGAGKGGANVAFASQTAGSPGTLRIRGKAGGTSTANINLGVYTVVDTGATTTVNFDLRGHDVDIAAGTLTMSRWTRAANSGSATSTLHFDTGVFTVNSVNMSEKTGNSTGTQTSTINIGGGTFTINAGAGIFRLGTQTGAGGSEANVNITGGTLTSFVDVTTGPGNTTATLNLSGGTLDLKGKNLGGAVAIDQLRFESGTLRAVGQINAGAGLSKTTSGTLIVEGTNTYTGTTTVSAGTLLVNGSLTSPVVVQAGATLGGTGTILDAVSLDATAILSPGTSPGVLSVDDLTLVTDSVHLVEIDGPGAVAGTNYDQVIVADTLDLGGATLQIALGSNSLPAGSALTIIRNDGLGGTGQFAGLANGDVVPGTPFRIFYTGGDGNDVVLVEVSTPTVVYVEDSAWDLLTPGTFIADADFGTAATEGAIFGINAFTNLTDALAAVAAGGVIIVNDGTYSEAITLAAGLTLRLTQQSPGTDGTATIGGMNTLAGSTIDLASNTLAVGLLDGTDTLSGLVTGSGGLTKVGAGTLNLAGNNIGFTGTTTVEAGTLRLVSSPTVNPLGSSDVILNGGTLTIDAAAPTVVAENALKYLLIPRSATGIDTMASLDYSAVKSVISSGQFSFTSDTAFTNLFNTGIGLPGALPGLSQYTVIGIGTYTPSVTGTHGFISVDNDDAAAVWVDVNRNGIFDGPSERLVYDTTNGGDINSTLGSASLTQGLGYTFAILVQDTGGGGKLGGGYLPSGGGRAFINPSTQAGLWSVQEKVGADFSNNNITVTDNATVELRVNGATFNQLTIGADTLTVTGSNDGNSSGLGATLTFDNTVTLTDAAVFNTDKASLQFDGQVTGTGSITKQGKNNLTLTNDANDYDGTTTVLGGALIVTANNALGDAGALATSGTSVESGGQLILAGGITLPENVSIIGNGPTGGSGNAGALLNLGANTLAGQLTIGTSARTTSGTGTLTLAGGVSVAAGQTWDVDGEATTVIDTNPITGSGNINKITTAGANSLLVINTENTGYTGTFTINGGTVAAGTDTAFGTGTLQLQAGTLRSTAPTVSGGDRTFANAVNFTGNITLGDATNNGVLTFDGTGNLTGARTLTLNSSVAYAGNLTGAAGNHLTKAGTGTLTLAGNNTFAGATLVTAGTLIAESNTALGTTGNGTRVEAAATLLIEDGVALVAEGIALAGTLVGAGTSSLAGTIDIFGDAVITTTTAGSVLTLSGRVLKPNSHVLTFAGPGSVILTGDVLDDAISFAPITARHFAAVGLNIDSATAAGNNINTLANNSGTTSQTMAVTLNGPINFPTNSDTQFASFFPGQTVAAFTAVFVSEITVTRAGSYYFSFSQNENAAAVWVDTNDDGTFQAGERVQYITGTNNTAVPGAVLLNVGTYRVVWVVQDNVAGNSGLVARWDYALGSAPHASTAMRIATSLADLSDDRNVIVKTGTGSVRLAGSNDFHSVVQVQQGTWIAASDSALGAATSDTAFVPASSMTQLWQLGIDNGGQGEFGQEVNGSTPAPGSATAKDDDYYFAGTYPSPIGTVATSEPATNFERALTKTDTVRRIHFNLTADQLNDNFQILVDTIASDFNSGGPIPVEILFNGVVVHYQVVTANGLMTSAVFNGLDVNATTGDNVITIRRPTLGGGNWVQFDFIRLNSQSGAFASGTHVASSGTLAFENVNYTSPEVVSLVGSSTTGVAGIAALGGASSFSGAITVQGDLVVDVVTGSTLELPEPVTVLGGPVRVANFAGFPSSDGLTLVGNASVTGGVLQLTPAIGNQRGSAWLTEKQIVAGGFTTEFTFNFPTTSAGADGMSFVVHNDPQGTAANPSESGDQIDAGTGLVIEFDSYNNGGVDPSNAHISVWAGTGVLLQTVNLAVAPFNIANLGNSGPHTVRVEYLPGSLQIIFDDVALFGTPLNITLGQGQFANAMDANGRAWFGFGARTGGVFEQHLISSWTIDNQPNLLGDVVKTGGGLFRHVDSIAYAGELLVDEGTFELTSGASIVHDVTVAAGGTLAGTATVDEPVVIEAGGTLSPGVGGPGQLNLDQITLADTSVFVVDLQGTFFTPGTDFDRLNVVGGVNLGGATLDVNVTGTPGALTTIVLINQGGTDAVIGTFKDTGGQTLANGDVVTGTSFRIFYTGGDGNDVILVETTDPTIVYVEDTAWDLLTPGTFIADADFGTVATEGAILGVNAFTNLADALAAVAAGGVIIINDGTYAESVTLDAGLTLRLTQQSPGNDSIVTIGSLATAAGSTVELVNNTLEVGSLDVSVTVSGVISGTGNLTKQGTGSVTLASANTYTGITTIEAGIIRLGNAQGLGTEAGKTVIESGGTLDINGFRVGPNGNELIEVEGTGAGGNGAIINTGAAQQNALRRVVLTGDTLFNAVNRFDIRATGGAATLDMNGFTLTKIGGQTFALVGLGVVSDPGSVFVNQGLFGIETNTRFDSLNNNSINLASGTTLSFYASTLTHSVAINSNTATIAARGGTNFIGTVTLSGAVTLTGTSTFETSNAGTNVSASMVVSGPITGTGGLTKTSGAMLTLSNATNDYAGITTINAGTLRATTGNALGSTAGETRLNGGLLELNGNFTTNETFNIQQNATIRNATAGSTVTLAGSFTRTTQALTLDAVGNFVLDAAIPGSGTVIKDGAGRLDIADVQTYTGATEIRNGTVQAMAADVLAPTSAVILNGAASTLLDLNGHSQTIGSLAGGWSTGGHVDLGGSAAVLTVGGNGTNTLYRGSISGNGGVVKAGAGTWTLGGQHTWTGTLLVQAGTVELEQFATEPGTSGSLPIWLDATDLNGDMIDDAGSTPDGTAIASWANKGSGGAILNANQGNAAAQPEIDTGVLNGLDMIRFQRPTSTTAEWLEINNAAVQAIVNGPHTFFVVGLTTSGGEDTNNNNGQGLVGMPGNHSGIRFAGGAAGATGVQSEQWVGGSVPGGGTTGSMNSSLAYQQGNAGVFGGVVTETAGGSSNQLFANGVAGPLSTNGGQLTNYTNNIIRLGAFNTSGTFIWGLNGAIGEVLVFNTALDATARAQVESYLYGKWFAAAGMNSLSDSLTIEVAGGATFDLNDHDEAVGSLSGSGNVSLGSGTLTLNVTADAEFSGNASGSGTLVKQGAAVQTLSGTNSLTGDVIVSAGTLELNGSVAGDVLIQGGTLSGDGTIGGDLTVDASGLAVSPGGTSIATLTVNGSVVTFDAASSLLIDVSSTTGDQLSVTGPAVVTLGGSTLVVSVGVAPSAGQTFTIIDNVDPSSTISGTFDNLPEGTAITVSGQVFTISYIGGDGNDVVLTAEGTAETDVSINGSGHLVVTDINGGTSDDRLTIWVDGTDLVIRDDSLTLTTAIPGATRPDAQTVRVSLADFTGEIWVNTLDGSDRLTLDFSNGIPRIVRLDGGTAADELFVTGGAFGSVAVQLTAAENGSIDLSIVDVGADVFFLGVESLDTTGSSSTGYSITLPATNDEAVLEDASGDVRLRSTAATATFTSVSFERPIGTLALDAAGGTDSLRLDVDPNLIGSLIVTAETITLAADVTTFGNQTYTGAVVLDTNITLNSTLSGGNGNITVNGGVGTQTGIESLVVIAGTADIAVTGAVNVASLDTTSARINITGALTTTGDAEISTTDGGFELSRLQGAISIGGDLIKQGGGRLDVLALLAGVTGDVVIEGGTLSFNRANGVYSVDGQVILVNGTLRQVAAGSTFTIDQGIVDGNLSGATNANVQVATGSMTVVSGGMAVDVLTIAVDRDTASLTVQAGDVRIGTADSSAAGTGTLRVGGRTESRTDAAEIGTLDLRGASSVLINVATVQIGVINNIGGSSQARGTLLLSESGSNTILATTITVGDSPQAGNTGGISQIVLGQTNVIRTNTLELGRRKSSGTMSFSDQTTDPTLVLTNRANNGGANVRLGFNDAGNTNTVSRGTLDLTGGSASLLVNQLDLGLHGTGGTTTWGGIGTFTFEDGTVTVTTVALGIENGNTSGTLTEGTINQNGGTFRFGTMTGQIGRAEYNWTAGVIANITDQNATATNVAFTLIGNSPTDERTFDVQTGRTISVPGLNLADAGDNELTKVGGGILSVGSATTFESLEIVEGFVSVAGDLSLTAGTNYTITLRDTDSGNLIPIPGADYGQTVVTPAASSVNLNGATLDLSLDPAFSPPVGAVFVLIDNQSGAAISGVFVDAAGDPLLEGDTIFTGGVPFRVTYQFNTATGEDFGGNDVALIVTDAPVLQGTAGDDEYRVFLDAGKVVVTHAIEGGPAVEILRRLRTELVSIGFEGRAGDDTVIVDHAGGDPLAGLLVTFDGGEGSENGVNDDNVASGDSVSLVHGTAASIAYTLTDIGGTIAVDVTGSNASTITFTNLEDSRPIRDELDTSAGERSFLLTADGEQAVLTASGSGTTLLDSTASDTWAVDFTAATDVSLTLTGVGSQLTVNGVATGFATNLTLTAPEILLNNGGIATAGTQTYDGAVTLGVDTTIAATEASFLGILTGNGHALTLNTSIQALLAGDVSGVGLLTSDVGGQLVIATGSVAAAALDVNDAVLVATDTVLTIGGLADFASTIDSSSGGPFDLTLTAGRVLFGDAIGQTSVLDVLQVTSADALNLAVLVRTAGDVVLTVTDSTAVGEDLTLTGGAVIQSGGNVSLSAGDNITLALGTTIQAAGSVDISADLAGDPGVGANVLIDGQILASLTLTITTGEDDDLVDYHDLRAGSIAAIIRTSGGNDTVHIIGTPATGTLLIETGAGDDSIALGSNTGSLDPVTLAMSIDAGGGLDTLSLDDSGDASSNAYELTATTLDRNATGLPLIVYTGLETLNLLAGAGDDTLTILSTPAEMTADLSLGGGNDATILGGSLSLLNGIAGPIVLQGGLGTDTLLVDDSADATDNAGLLTATTLSGLGLGGGMTYLGLEEIDLRLGRGNDRLTVSSTAAGVPTLLDFGAGNDTLALAIDAAGPVVVTVRDALGSDTVDFSASEPVIFDMDLTAAQAVNARGDTLTMLDPFENVIGSLGADTFFVDPLTGVPRSIQGRLPTQAGLPDLNGNWPTGDRVVFETFGNSYAMPRFGGDGTMTVDQSGGTGSFAPITFTSIERITIQNPLDLRGLPGGRITFGGLPAGGQAIDIGISEIFSSDSVDPVSISETAREQFQTRGRSSSADNDAAYVLLLFVSTANGPVPVASFGGDTLADALKQLRSLELDDADYVLMVQADDDEAIFALPEPDGPNDTLTDEQIQALLEAIEEALESEGDEATPVAAVTTSAALLFGLALSRPLGRRNRHSDDWADDVDRFMDRFGGQ